MDSKSKSGSRGSLPVGRPFEPSHHYEIIGDTDKNNLESDEFPKIRRESLEKAYDAFCDADYENVNFSLPLEIKPSSTNVSRIKSSPFKSEKKIIESKESLTSVKKSVVEKTESNNVPETTIRTDKKLTCSVVSELLKSDIKTNVESQPKTAETATDLPKVVSLTKSPDEFAKRVDELTRIPSERIKNSEKLPKVDVDKNIVSSREELSSKPSAEAVKHSESPKISPITEDIQLIQDLEVQGKTEKLRKFFEKEKAVAKSESAVNTSVQAEDIASVNEKSLGKIVYESPVKKDCLEKKDFVRTGSLSKFEFVSTNSREKESATSSIRQLSRSPSHSRTDFSPSKLNESRPSFEFFQMKEAEAKSKEVKSPVKSPIHKFEIVKKDLVSPVKDENKGSTQKVGSFQNSKESDAKNAVNPFKTEENKSKEEVKSQSRPKLEPLPLKDVSPTHRLVSPDSPSHQDKKLAGESEAERRERIEKYKEERRSFFRNKYKMDNVNNNSDEDLIRRIKEKTARGDGVERRKSGTLVTDPKRSPNKTTVSILYSPTRCQAPAWPPNHKSTSPASYPNR